jgi:hypothetical protein
MASVKFERSGFRECRGRSRERYGKATKQTDRNEEVLHKMFNPRAEGEWMAQGWRGTDTFGCIVFIAGDAGGWQVKNPTRDNPCSGLNRSVERTPHKIPLHSRVGGALWHSAKPSRVQEVDADGVVQHAGSTTVLRIESGEGTAETRPQAIRSLRPLPRS